jgi:hypothetical protein
MFGKRKTVRLWVKAREDSEFLMAFNREPAPLGLDGYVFVVHRSIFNGLPGVVNLKPGDPPVQIELRIV